MRTLAIGDIHGSSGQLDVLLGAIRLKPTDRLIFLGDYVDRGPDSSGVLARLLALNHSHPNCTFLLGNHELMMMRSRKDRAEMRMWLSVGGVQTLASYGPTGKLANVPDTHWEFLSDHCVNYFETESHIFVHANLNPELPLDEQEELMLFWEFLTGPIHHYSGKTVICGHTSQRSGEILDFGNTICIDTFAYGGGNLTCLDVTTRQYWQVGLMGRVVQGDLD